MKNKLDYILLSLLLGTSVLLGLTFWLNTNFGFNLFCAEHWEALSKLQASNTPVSNGFYISIAVALLIFIIGLYIIYIPYSKHNKPITEKQPTTPTVAQEEKKEEIQKTESAPLPTPSIPITRPPKLNLPANMAQIVAQKQNAAATQNFAQKNTNQSNPFDSVISQIFTDNGYVVKTNPVILGFTPNLFAIGNNEIVWIGAVDSDINKLQSAIEKLQSVFQETLQDIQIYINAFMLDNMNKYQSTDSITVFKSIDELKEFIAAHPADDIPESEQDNFDSYSEYIDTIIKYIRNV